MKHYDHPVGISILTNSNRCLYLKSCIDALLSNCYYRPLVIGIMDNGSTDETASFLAELPEVYGVTWRLKRSEADLGCAKGTNMALELVSSNEYAIHIESDFIHMEEAESGVGKLWLREAIDGLMESGDCDYLYLRRMRNPHEMMNHWWSQWMPMVVEERGSYLKCPGFWWSNNPALRRVRALYECGTLPLNVSIDGGKGTPGWSVPEMEASRPTRAWIHRWGMFKHEEIGAGFDRMTGCGLCEPVGTSSCKYGFYQNPATIFCQKCDKSVGFQDMPFHEKRFRGSL